MVFVVDEDGIFERRKSGQGENSGNGVFCLDRVSAGTMLPYYGITITDDDDDECECECECDCDCEMQVEIEHEIDHDHENACDDYRTYVIGADYTTARGNRRSADGLSVDGDPRLPEIKELPEYKQLACQVNEAGAHSLPNCLLVSNPAISRADIKRSLAKKVPIPISFIVVIEDLPGGTELLTVYGDEYGERGYPTCKMKRSKNRELADIAYSFVDQLTTHFQQ